jgi:flagellar operon protein
MDPKDLKAVGTPPIIPGPAPRPAGKPVQIPPAGAPSFRSVLEQQQGTSPAAPLKFSAHAMQRLQSRNIQLSNEDVARMNQMADKAAQKGAKQSLFMLRDVAMVVSIKNRTVITAVDQESMKENVFTNIDSAAVIS